jgi:protein O-mannosyl-transferase
MTEKATLTERQFDWIMRFFVALFVGVVFWPAIFGSFVNWDDGVNLTDNPHLTFTWENIVWMFTDCHYVPRYLPLGWFFYGLEHNICGQSSLLCHGANWLVHIANALLLYGILKKILALWRKESADKYWGHGAAAVGALWWGVNPMRTETVAWASGFIYAVAGFFFFLSVWCYLRQKIATDNQDVSPSSNRRMAWLSGICFGASLLTYPIALGGLGVFVILDILMGRLPMKIMDWWRRPYWRIWLQKAYFLTPAMFMFLVTWLTVTNRSALGQSHLGLPTHFLQACWVWAWYVWKPWMPFDLSPKYPDLLGDSFFTPQHLAAAFLVVSITVLAILWRRRWPSLLGIWVCYITLTAPFIGPTQHPHYTNDRYCYIMGGVWALAIAMVFLLLLRNPKWRLSLGAAAVLACGFFGWQSRVQTFFWNNSLNLHTWMAEKIDGHPEGAMHECYMARIYLLLERPNEALPPLRRAVSIEPKNADNWTAYGDVLAQQKYYEPAIASFRKAIHLIPDMDTTRNRLALTLAKAGRPEEALKEFTWLLEKYTNLAELHTNIAPTLEALGRTNDAKEHLKKAAAIEQESSNQPPNSGNTR